MLMMEEKPHAYEDMLRTVYDAFAKGDVTTVMSLLTDDIEYHVSGRSPVSGTYKGKGEVLGLFGKLMELSGGTFRIEIQDVLANDKHGVTLTIERGHRAGKTLENRAVHVWDIRDGKSTRFRGYNDDTWDAFWS
ncbi:MAG: nuclear transport factor 2 family protein [Pseudonocardiaceae bacterium]